MIKPPEKCPICQTSYSKEYNAVRPDALRIDCHRCGEYDISGTALATIQAKLNAQANRRAIMSHSLRRMAGLRQDTKPFVSDDSIDSFFKSDRLPTPKKQADDATLLIGDLQISPDQHLRISGNFFGSWIGTSIPNSLPDGVDWILRHLRDQHLADSRETASVESGRMFSIGLTMAGWEKYAQLKRVDIASRTAFMAMKFGDKSIDSVVDNCFKPAVARTGFELKKLTDDQPAGLIDDQIRASILSGRFVIADLTHGSHGAYWEAGFAEGLGLPVIYTCERSHWEERKTHFDTNHLLTIVWDSGNLEKTGQELAATIRATLRKEAIQSSVFD